MILWQWGKNRYKSWGKSTALLANALFGVPLSRSVALRWEMAIGHPLAGFVSRNNVLAATDRTGARSNSAVREVLPYLP